MPVKDLVGLFELIPSINSAPPRRQGVTGTRGSRRALDDAEPSDTPQSERTLSELDNSPRPLPAKFRGNPFSQASSSSSKARSGSPNAPFMTNYERNDSEGRRRYVTESKPLLDHGYDRRDELQQGSEVVHPGPTSVSRCTTPDHTDFSVKLPMGMARKKASMSDAYTSFSLGMGSGASSSTLAAMSKGTRSSSSTSVIKQKPHWVAHMPVPGTDVFARGSPPLYLPKLNNHLASLHTPSFTCIAAASKLKEPITTGMFPPMNNLAATGKTIQDLETNSTVSPPWRNKSSIFSSLVGLALAATGSSVLANFYSLQGVLDTIQIFALLLSTLIPHAGRDLTDRWKALLLGTIPNVLALNFASTLIQSLLFLLLFMVIAALLLYYFFISTNRCNSNTAQEGLQPTAGTKRRWDLVIVSFILTVIYLPLSTIAVHALVWSDDFWVVANPYINATSNPPIVPPLGPPDQFRNPLDFCYTTTMKRNEVNFAPIVVIISAATFLFMTIWFPFRLRKVITEAVPRVDRYTELGKARSHSDMDREYQRLLDRDRNPIAFLYNDFRRGWGTYRSFYLFAKLSTLLIIAVIDPDNCLFRTLPRARVSVVRQALLVFAMLAFFSLQCFLAPFVNPVNNAGEWISRVNYVLTALAGLGVALYIPGYEALNGPVLYIIYIVTYGLSFYFTVINFSWMRRVVKRITRRIDFSIDIYSPWLDITPSSPHLKRRIWQEAISALFLTSPECKIPAEQQMIFSQARNSEYPPYLLNFTGSPAERHVENLKILREVGSVAYAKGVALISGDDLEYFHLLQGQIQRQFVGPDCYWKYPDQPARADSTKHFGNAWWIPFPPAVVLQYDDGPLVVLKEMRDLEQYIAQNQSPHVQRKREVRMALRALDGHVISWPYEHHQVVGARANLLCCGGRNYQARTTVKYQTCSLHIKRSCSLIWEGLELSSGFDVELSYAKDVRVDGAAIGLNDEYQLTPALAHFLYMNRSLISANLPHIEKIIQAYRNLHWKECRTKANVLSYAFLTRVYEQPQQPKILAENSMPLEYDLRVRQLIVGSEAAFQASYERHAAVASSRERTWWYIFWDDLWRRNFDTIKPLQVHSQDFDPHYHTSIAYRPLPRSALETFLLQRGLMSKSPKQKTFFHSGLLNKIYLRLNEIVFHGSDYAIGFHLGDDVTEIDLEDIDNATQARSSTLGTGGGTDHDDGSIRARPNYRWEGILEDPLSKHMQHKQGWIAKLGVWFGITPLWRTGIPSKGLALDVKLENGRYVLLELEGKDHDHRK